MLKKIIIGGLAVIGMSVVLMVGCSMMAVSTVDNAIQEVERQYAEDSNEIQDIMNQVQWNKVNDYGYQLEGTFVNSAQQTISYLDAKVKFYDVQGNVINTAYILETDISAGESRRIEVYAGDDFDSFEIIVDTEWSHFE